MENIKIEIQEDICSIYFQKESSMKMGEKIKHREK